MPRKLIKSVWKYLTHPGASLVYVLGLLSQLFGIPWLDALWMTLWANAGTAFTATSVILTQAPTTDGKLFGLVPMAWATAFSYGLGALFVVTLLDRLYDSFKQRVQNE